MTTFTPVLTNLSRLQDVERTTETQTQTYVLSEKLADFNAVCSFHFTTEVLKIPAFLSHLSFCVSENNIKVANYVNIEN